MKKLLILLLLLLVPFQAISKTVKHHYNPVLKGSYEVAIKQNQEIDRLHLPRIVDRNQLVDLIKTGELVRIQPSPYFYFSPVVNPYCREWTYSFMFDLGKAFYGEFKKPIPVSSVVRTVEQQQELRKHNRYAAPETGETSSSHLAGITFDLSKRMLTSKQKVWMVSYLKKYRDAGLIEAIEEPQCFHICVNEIYNRS